MAVNCGNNETGSRARPWRDLRKNTGNLNRYYDADDGLGSVNFDTALGIRYQFYALINKKPTPYKPIWVFLCHN